MTNHLFVNAFFRRMHRFVFTSIAPEVLGQLQLDVADFERWNRFLLQAVQELKPMMAENLIGVSASVDKLVWMQSIQLHLTELSDQVNGYLFRKRKLWNENNLHPQIRLNYLKTLTCFQDLLEYAAKHYPACYDQSIRMTRFKMLTIRPEFRVQITMLNDFLLKSGIEDELRLLIVHAARSAKRSATFSDADLVYFQRMFREILKHEGLTQQELVELLIGFDFNKREFYVYMMRQWKKLLEGAGGLHEQLELMVHKHVEFGDKLVPGIRAQSNRPSLIADLLVYCRRHKEYLHELIELRKMLKQDEFKMEGAFRILSGFSVPQIALFFKLQVEKGFIMPKSLASLYRFIAGNFYTEKALMISEHSLKREYEDVKFKTAYKMYLALLEFIEWLDEHFQVKSYRPA
jgi:hypothetical protein